MTELKDDEEIDSGTGSMVPGVEGQQTEEQLQGASDAFSSAELVIAQPYVQKGVCFFLLVAVALYIARRRQLQKTSYLDAGKSDEKSMA